VKLGWTWGEPGVNLGWTWGEPGVNLRSTWCEPGVNLGWTWGEPTPPYQVQREQLAQRRLPRHRRAIVQRRKLKLKAKFESGSSRLRVKRWNQARSSRGQSTWGRSTCTALPL
jgi:hypothetical protein